MNEEMLERNKAVVQRWIELWNTKGAEGVDEVFASNFRDPQLEQRLAEPLTLDVFKESLRALDAAIGHARFEERELLAEGDRVMVRWTMYATHQGPFWGLPPTGRSFALDGVNIFRVEDERIAERLSYVDAASLLAQLGQAVEGTGLEERMAALDWAVEQRDVGAADAVLDADYALVLTHPTLALMPRRRWLEVLPDYIVHEYAVRERQVDIDGDCACALQRVDMRATVLGEDRSGTFVISDVWRLRASEWHLWRRHSTPLEAGAMPGT